jgi:hypothetical protein
VHLWINFPKLLQGIVPKTNKMNFLSHFYFERHHPYPERVLGVLLPDLLKNANKDLNIHPSRLAVDTFIHPQVAPIYEGWLRHIHTDRVFHNLPFFFEHTHALKLALQPLLVSTPIRPSFLSHIGLELLLDHLLIIDRLVDVEDFYDALEKVDPAAIRRFLQLSGVDDPQFFFHYFQGFMRHRYVASYVDLDQVVYALIQICKRVWSVDKDMLDWKAFKNVLEDYANILKPQYIKVFQEIDASFVKASPY